MKIHDRISELVQEYQKGSDIEIHLGEPFEGICFFDSKYVWRCYGDEKPVRSELSLESEFTLEQILLDPNVRDLFGKMLWGHGSQVQSVRREYRIFEYGDTWKIVIFEDDNYADLTWQDFADITRTSTNCVISFYGEHLGILDSPLWKTLKLWPGFNKEFLICALGLLGYRFISLRSAL